MKRTGDIYVRYVYFEIGNRAFSLTKRVKSAGERHIISTELQQRYTQTK